ncbi:DsbA family protein [Solirhodobacter olei]|uniref:DsbA family protein n=1 Tax=Solirhodobacter olei TaxID=2493082 RepID=UPI0013E2B173|nr:DsbA family protein [Solirhodobacter olei]
MNRRNLLTAGGAILAGGLWQGALAASASGGGDASTAAPKVPDMTVGSPNAKVHVIEYGSFTCPHCAEFHGTVWPKLKKAYIDSGKISFTFRSAYRNGYDLLADTMALCGGPIRYFGIVDVLFNTQNKWTDVQTLDQAAVNLEKIGEQAGITPAELKACMADKKMQQAMVAKFQKDAAVDKVEYTPTFIIDGKHYENMGYADFAKILDAELARLG